MYKSYYFYRIKRGKIVNLRENNSHYFQIDKNIKKRRGKYENKLKIMKILKKIRNRLSNDNLFSKSSRVRRISILQI